jgi:hypothetical protein
MNALLRCVVLPEATMSMNPFSKAASKPSDASKPSAFAPVRLAQALFSKQVKFKRGEDGYKFVLENSSPNPPGSPASASMLSSSPTAPTSPTSPTSPTTPTPSALALAAAEQAPPVTSLSSLAELMDSAPGSRNAFRHLASIEASLHHKGADALFLFDLSAVHLKQALRQLDGLWMEPAPPVLAELRAKMADALAAQESRDKEVALSRGSFNVLSSFLVDEKMQVSEGRASDFHQLSESWGGPTLAPLER